MDTWRFQIVRAAWKEKKSTYTYVGVSHVSRGREREPEERERKREREDRPSLKSTWSEFLFALRAKLALYMSARLLPRFQFRYFSSTALAFTDARSFTPMPFWIAVCERR